MREKKRKMVNTNLGILLICLFSSIFTMADFLIIDHVLDKYFDYSKCECAKCGDSNLKLDGAIDDTPVIDDKKDTEIITQDELTNIIENELFVFYGKTSLNDITNQDKLSLAVRLMVEKNNAIIQSFTSSELEDSFNSTVISNLGINHENIVPIKSVTQDGNLGFGYTYENGVYRDRVSTNSGTSSVPVVANKIVSFSENDGRYTLSIKYLWASFGEYIMGDNSLYGKYTDSINHQNSIGELPEGLLVGSYENLQNWGNENFSSFEDKLEKYNFVFIKENGKITLINFYVD